MLFRTCCICSFACALWYLVKRPSVAAICAWWKACLHHLAFSHMMLGTSTYTIKWLLLKAGSQYDNSPSFRSISSVVVVSSLLQNGRNDGIETISTLLSTTVETIGFLPIKHTRVLGCLLDGHVKSLYVKISRTQTLLVIFLFWKRTLWAKQRCKTRRSFFFVLNRSTIAASKMGVSSGPDPCSLLWQYSTGGVCLSNRQ